MTPEDIASKLLLSLSEQLNNDENEYHIDMQEVDLTDFFHALANILPTYIFNKYTGEDKNQLEFNHIANQLCFQYAKKN